MGWNFELDIIDTGKGFVEQNDFFRNTEHRPCEPYPEEEYFVERRSHRNDYYNRYDPYHRHNNVSNRDGDRRSFHRNNSVSTSPSKEGDDYKRNDYSDDTFIIDTFTNDQFHCETDVRSK